MIKAILKMNKLVRLW